MNEICTRTRDYLQQASELLKRVGLEGLVSEVQRLEPQVDQPCVVAVVGRVKAGKSSFINALLDEDLAKVGVTETTATINRFTYGTPQDPNRPVRCHWRGGQTTNETRDFLDSLQGHNTDALRKAEGIRFLEYLLPNETLKQITLVDTPGTGAMVDEHQDRVDEFLIARRQLADRHAQDSEEIAAAADAVIHLVGPAARATDRQMLEQFGESMGGNHNAFNAIGVLSKIDLYPDLLGRREPLCEKIALQLKRQLNTVIPVSAAMHPIVCRLQEEPCLLRQLIETLRQIPVKRMDMLLDNESFFMDLEFADCPVDANDRRQLRSMLDGSGSHRLPWRAFALSAKIAADRSLNDQQVIDALVEAAGFGPLMSTLRRHFFGRSRLLRCHRILTDARRVIDRIRFDHVLAIESEVPSKQPRLEAMLSVLATADGGEDLQFEIEEMIRAKYDCRRRAAQLNTVWKELELGLAEINQELLDYNGEFAALTEIENHASDFTNTELAELRPLLGMYGLDLASRLAGVGKTIETVRSRQLTWKRSASQAKNSARRIVCHRAEKTYRQILYKLTSTNDTREADAPTVALRRDTSFTGSAILSPR